MPTEEEDRLVDELETEGTCSQAEPHRQKGNARGHGAEREASFARVTSVYPHPSGQRERAPCEPHALSAWRKLDDVQKAEAIAAAPHAPGKIWVGHWLDEAREARVFEIFKKPAAGPGVWVSEGTPQHAAWTDCYRSLGRPLLRTQRRIDGQLRTGWMFESEWPPNSNTVQRDGGAA
jgi:hypothetical protein